MVTAFFVSLPILPSMQAIIRLSVHPSVGLVLFQPVLLVWALQVKTFLLKLVQINIFKRIEVKGIKSPLTDCRWS